MKAETLSQRARQRLSASQEQGKARQLRIEPHRSNFIDLSTNNYLKLAQHESVVAAACEATQKWGASSSASPLISGYKPPHKNLEEKLMRWLGFPSALLWNSGYIANHALLSELAQREDLILADRLVHGSFIDGALSSKARLQRYRHLDDAHLSELLEKNQHRYEVIFVVTESLFSMDGDMPNLEAFARLKEKFKFIWVVDESHAIGWYGPFGNGLCQKKGVLENVDILVGSLGKSLGSFGAFMMFRDAKLRGYLIDISRKLRYSTYLPAACAAAASAAIEEILLMEKERREAQKLSRAFRKFIGTMDADAPIVPFLTGSPDATLKMQNLLKENGFLVSAIRPPTVPENTSRLRLSLDVNLTAEELHPLADLLNAMPKIRI